MNTFKKRITPITAIVLLSVLLLSACAAEEPRIPTVYSVSAGGQFSVNYDQEDLRRQLKCSITFEVIDEDAIAELELISYKVRNSVLTVLSSLSEREVIQGDLEAISEKIVERVNMDINARGGMTIVTRAYFTEYIIV